MQPVRGASHLKENQAWLEACQDGGPSSARAAFDAGHVT
ncbi:hypothetical protein D187_000111 [Cystobacter fuscus DSM 2262]|uniref:Uncharacterized protein n=1 Tax=Cystobacter fuscus (strain ATCC 25194 / DSM 2262 / NBRC 100088 / M29) TaxID=1242864 RepID=S9QTR8_CYSF2|nr:hypothetical protein D187_000111 [Cystobacter fuscus DSM 2262]